MILLAWEEFVPLFGGESFFDEDRVCFALFGPFQLLLEFSLIGHLFLRGFCGGFSERFEILLALLWCCSGGFMRNRGPKFWEAREACSKGNEEMNWASKQDDSLVVHNSKSPGTQKNQVNKGPESSESMATIAVDSVTERKKMGMKGRNIYVTDETKVVSAELANNLLDDRRGTFFWKLTWNNMEFSAHTLFCYPKVKPYWSDTLFRKFLREVKDMSCREILCWLAGKVKKRDFEWFFLFVWAYVTSPVSILSKVVAVFAIVLSYRVSIEVGEFLALREGLGVAKQLGCFVALTVVDASNVVAGINLEKPSLCAAGFIINDIQALCLEVGI
ncbi:hypothetical protein ACOSQ4_008294 [Xanthoceras sorbifolium]